MAHVPRLALEHVNVGLCLDMFEIFVYILCALNSSTNSRYHPEYVPRNQDLLISRTPTAPPPPYLQADRDSSAAQLDSSLLSSLALVRPALTKPGIVSDDS